MQNVVDTVFGDSAKSINDWSKSALNAYGLSELSAKEFTSTMGAMLDSMGLSDADRGRHVDISSWAVRRHGELTTSTRKKLSTNLPGWHQRRNGTAKQRKYEWST